MDIPYSYVLILLVEIPTNLRKLPFCRCASLASRPVLFIRRDPATTSPFDLRVEWTSAFTRFIPLMYWFKNQSLDTDMGGGGGGGEEGGWGSLEFYSEP